MLAFSDPDLKESNSYDIQIVGDRDNVADLTLSPGYVKPSGTLYAPGRIVRESCWAMLLLLLFIFRIVTHIQQLNIYIFREVQFMVIPSELYSCDL